MVGSTSYNAARKSDSKRLHSSGMLTRQRHESLSSCPAQLNLDKTLQHLPDSLQTRREFCILQMVRLDCNGGFIRTMLRQAAISKTKWCSLPTINNADVPIPSMPTMGVTLQRTRWHLFCSLGCCSSPASTFLGITASGCYNQSDSSVNLAAFSWWRTHWSFVSLPVIYLPHFEFFLSVQFLSGSSVCSGADWNPNPRVCAQTLSMPCSLWFWGLSLDLLHYPTNLERCFLLGPWKVLPAWSFHFHHSGGILREMGLTARCYVFLLLC